MITISEEGRSRLVIADTERGNAEREFVAAVGWTLTCWLAVSALYAATGHSTHGYFVPATLAFMAVVVVVCDMRLARMRSTVEIDGEARRVIRHRRGVLRWRRELRFADLWGIDVRRRAYTDESTSAVDWQLRLMVRGSDRHPVVLGDCREPEDLRPALMRVAAATGLSLSVDAQLYLKRSDARAGHPAAP